MGYRTCEEYVLAQLAEQQDEVDRVTRENLALRERLGAFERREADPISREVERLGTQAMLDECTWYALPLERDKAGDPVGYDEYVAFVTSRGSTVAGVPPEDVARRFEPQLRERGWPTVSRGIAGVNEVLFRQLERLEAVGTDDVEAMRAEIERSRAVEGIAGRVIENGKLVLDVAKAGTAVGEAVHVPRGLLS